MSGIAAIQAINPAESVQAWLQVAAASEAEVAALAQAPELPQAALSLPGPVGEAHAAQPSTLLAQPLDAPAAVQPLAPALLTPLALQQGPELRWRVQDAAAWRSLLDTVGDAVDDDEAALASPAEPDAQVPADDIPAWAQALLARLREAAEAPASVAPLRPALQAWRAGLPVLLASPSGLASLQPGRDGASWCWRRWPARWRQARPATGERWWAVRLGLAAQGRPRTLRELGGALRLAPGQVSCELRLDGTAPGIAQWAEVLVQAPASASLRGLLGARPSLTWLLCNQPLWPVEAP